MVWQHAGDCGEHPLCIPRGVSSLPLRSVAAAREECMASERPGVSRRFRRRTCRSNRPPRRMNGKKLSNGEKGVAHGRYATYVGECIAVKLILRITHRER
eukprot:2349117-Pleurochrysis_carterae.AAC.1